MIELINMAGARGAWCTVVIVLLLMVAFEFVGGPGVNWGTLSINPLPPRHVVNLLQANGDQEGKDL